MKIVHNQNRLTIADAGIARIAIDISFIVFSIIAITLFWQSTPFGMAANVATTAVLIILIAILGVSLVRTRSWNSDFVAHGTCTVRSNRLLRRPDITTFDYDDIERMSIDITTFRGVTVYRVDFDVRNRGWVKIMDTKTYDPFFSSGRLHDTLSEFIRVSETSELIEQRQQRSFLNRRLF